jgi:hypothetical protein
VQRGRIEYEGETSVYTQICSRHDIIAILDKRRTSCVWSDEKATT